jgi:hypothetical protein
MGCPTSDPKSKPVLVRLGADDANTLSSYIKLTGVTRAEAIRRGIRKLTDDLPTATH